MTNDDKSINLILHSERNDGEGENYVLLHIFSKFRKYFPLWIVLTVCLGLISSGAALSFGKNVSTDKITALVRYSYKGAESGLDPNGESLDVNKIKSPGIISQALSVSETDEDSIENIRRNIAIEGVIPDEALDKIALYKGIYAKNGNIDAANALLDMNYKSTFYIITFDNIKAGVSLENGKNILDSMLGGYQDYFFRTYGYSKVMGISSAAIDYEDYDYPSAADIFEMTINDLSYYVNSIIDADDKGFRSGVTGYSFEDIAREIDSLEASDLSSFSAYVTANNITKNRDILLTYYDYKIKELGREADVSKSELDAVSASIDSYVKDKMMVMGETPSDNKEFTAASSKYDELIDRKMRLEGEYSEKVKKLDYYKMRLTALKNAGDSSGTPSEDIDSRIGELYDKVNRIIDITQKTSDDYYENVVFENAFNILVPASGTEHYANIIDIAVITGITEAAVLVFYVMLAVISGIRQGLFKEKKEDSRETV